MESKQRPTTVYDEPIDQAIAAYYAAVEAGRSAESIRQELLRAHPSLAAQLQEFFANLVPMEGIAAPLRVAVGPPPKAGPAVGTGAGPQIPGYEIVAELGRGGMGVVYRARHEPLGRLVALKMMLAGPYADKIQLERFLIEAKTVARLHHPNLARPRWQRRQNKSGLRRIGKPSSGWNSGVVRIRNRSWLLINACSLTIPTSPQPSAKR